MSRPVTDISSGSRCVSVSSTGRRVFYPESPWVDVPAYSDMWSSEPADSDDLSRLVGVFDLGAEFVADARRAIAASMEQSDDDEEIKAVSRALARQCISETQERGVLRNTDMQHDAIHVIREGSEGTAFDYGSNSFVGLHIDNEWLRGRSFLDKSNKAFGIIGANIGSAERYLLVVDRSAQQIDQDLGALGLNAGSAEELKDLFLERFPDYPVLRIRVEPSQAYFCNPQSLIHDGQANKSTDVDLSLLIFGNFEPIA